MLPPEGAQGSPLNGEDIFRRLQFRKYNTKFINIWLRNDPYLQSHKITATNARIAHKSMPPTLGKLLLLLESTRTPSTEENMGAIPTASPRCWEKSNRKRFSKAFPTLSMLYLYPNLTGSCDFIGSGKFQKPADLSLTPIPTHHPGRVHFEGNLEKHTI